MKRRTLDIIFSSGAAAVAALLLVGAMVLSSNEDFAKDYVRDQLTTQGITFKAADELSAAERSYTEARSGCLITFAGQAVNSGERAECWANEYIAGHLADPDRIKGADGRSYVELGQVQADLRAQIAAAEDAGRPTTAMQARLDEVTAARETVFKGEMLRGTLLTTYGFSELGVKAGEVATVAFAAAALVAIVAAAGFVHAFATPRTKEVEAFAHHTHRGMGEGLATS